MTKMQLFALSLLPALPAGLLLFSLVMGVTNAGGFGLMVWGLWGASFIAAILVLLFSVGILTLYRPEMAAAGGGAAASEAVSKPTDGALEELDEVSDDLEEFDDDEDFQDHADEMLDSESDDDLEDFDDDEDFV